MNFTIVELIQSMLAPGIMISACGLLILGMNNKYSLVVNRVRLLNEERRRLFTRASERDFNYEENVRLESISMQLSRLVYRVKLVRNAVLCYTMAVGSFVLTSLLIGCQFFFSVQLTIGVILAFLAGMLSVFVGVTFAAIETARGYSIINLEVKIDE